MLQIPNLVQRGQIKREKLPAQSHLSKELQLDFMGPNEYSINASISLKFIHNHFKEYKTDELLIPHEGQKLRLFHRFNEDDLDQYTIFLFDLRIGRIKAKVRTHFEIAKADYYKGTDFWWDLENHAMWSFNRDFINHLPQYLEAEFQKLDEARARRQLGGLNDL